MQVIIGLLRAAMVKSGAKNFLIDGFPRALDQAECFESMVKQPEMVLAFDCPEVRQCAGTGRAWGVSKQGLYSMCTTCCAELSAGWAGCRLRVVLQAHRAGYTSQHVYHLLRWAVSRVKCVMGRRHCSCSHMRAHALAASCVAHDHTSASGGAQHS